MPCRQSAIRVWGYAPGPVFDLTSDGEAAVVDPNDFCAKLKGEVLSRSRK
jgi:hypothetical protein